MRTRSIILCGLALIVLALPLSATAERTTASDAAVVKIAFNKKLKRRIIVTGTGLTLYMFAPDKQKRVTCKGQCAVIWPPLKLKAGQKPTAGGAARKALLGSDPNPSGGRVVTYNHWPLYTYISDSKPGQAKGQAIKLNGGYWYVLSPAGKVIKKKP